MNSERETPRSRAARVSSWSYLGSRAMVVARFFRSAIIVMLLQRGPEVQPAAGISRLKKELEMTRAFVALIVANAAAAAPALSQERWPFSIEANFGVGSGVTNREHRGNNTGLYSDLLLGARVDAIPIALTLGYQTGGWLAEELCVITLDGCVDVQPPSFPYFFIVSALAGWETDNAKRRVLLGPAAIAEGEEYHWTLGVAARADLFGGILGPLSAVASLRGALIPSSQGEAFALAAIGVGLRLR